MKWVSAAHSSSWWDSVGLHTILTGVLHPYMSWSVIFKCTKFLTLLTYLARLWLNYPLIILHQNPIFTLLSPKWQKGHHFVFERRKSKPMPHTKSLFPFWLDIFNLFRLDINIFFSTSSRRIFILIILYFQQKQHNKLKYHSIGIIIIVETSIQKDDGSITTLPTNKAIMKMKLKERQR
jgi:hypothetical protein